MRFTAYTGRHLTCVGDTFSFSGQGPLRRSCLQQWEAWTPALIVGIVAGPVAQYFQCMANHWPRDVLPPAWASFALSFSCLYSSCERLCLSQHQFSPLFFAASSVKALSDRTGGHLEECLCQYFPSPLPYQVLRVKHMLKYFTGSGPILTHINQTGTTRSGQEMMGHCSPGKHVNCC